MSEASIIPLTASGDLATLSRSVPTIFLTNTKGSDRFFDFFTSNIRNWNTRIAYYKAACQFSEWTKARGIDELQHVRPIHIASYIEQLLMRVSKPTVKQQLAALRMLFDWLVVGQVRQPRHTLS
jgi:integrase/recombinase XerD